MTTVGEDAGQAKVRRTKRALAIVTIIWLGCAVVVVAKRNQCGDLDVGLLQGLISFHEHYLACRPLNALGDFLAGVFAPLAFMWLAGAVYIQSQELNAQHSLMEAQKEQMADSAKAMKAQAETSLATKEFIQKQTEILQKQQELREQEQADETFDAALQRMEDAFGQGPFYLSFVTPRGPAVGVVEEKATNVKIALSASLFVNPIAAFRNLRLNIAQANQQFDGLNGPATELSNWSARQMKELVLHLSLLKSIEPRLSPSHSLRAHALQIDATLSETAKLVERCSRSVVATALITTQKPE